MVFSIAVMSRIASIGGGWMGGGWGGLGGLEWMGGVGVGVGGWPDTHNSAMPT